MVFDGLRVILFTIENQGNKKAVLNLKTAL